MFQHGSSEIGWVKIATVFAVSINNQRNSGLTESGWVNVQMLFTVFHQKRNFGVSESGLNESESGWVKKDLVFFFSKELWVVWKWISEKAIVVSCFPSKKIVRVKVSWVKVKVPFSFPAFLSKELWLEWKWTLESATVVFLFRQANCGAIENGLSESEDKSA